MNRRLLLLFAVLAECFLAFLLFAPRTSQNDQATGESTQWRDEPTPQAERVLRRQLIWEQWRPRLLWSLLLGNGVFIGASAFQIAAKRASRRNCQVGGI